MIATAEKIVDAGKAGLDTMSALFNIAFDSSARLLEMNLGASRSLIQEGADRAFTMLDTRSVVELFNQELALGQSVIEKVSECASRSYEIVSDGQRSMLQVIEPHIAELGREAPVGTDLALAAVMSALQVAKRAGVPLDESPVEASDEPVRRSRKSA